MGNIKDPHDKVFKASLSNIEIARDFFKIHLPQSILDQIDLNNLEYCNNSYVEQDLKGKFSDVVYYSKGDSGSGSYLYLLLEHQSTPDQLMPLRILKYQIAIIEQHLKQYPKETVFPIVYPILFFQGEENRKPYPYSLDILDLFFNHSFAEKTIAKPAFLVDLNRFSDEEIKSHNLIALLEYMQRHSRDRDLMLIINDLKQVIMTICDRIGSNENLLAFYLECNLYYIMSVGNVGDIREFIKQLETIPIIRGKIMGSLARKFEENGIIKGIIKGKKETARAMLAKGADINFIKEVTKLTIEDIHKLKEEASNKM